MLSGFWNGEVSDSAGIISFELVPVTAKQEFFFSGTEESTAQVAGMFFYKAACMLCIGLGLTCMYKHTLEAKPFPCWD